MPGNTHVFVIALFSFCVLMAAPVRGNCFDCCAYGTCPSGWTCCGCPSECYCCADNALCRSSGSGYSCSYRLNNFPWINRQESSSKAIATGALSDEEVDLVRTAGWTKEGGKNESVSGKVDGSLRGALRDDEIKIAK